MELHLYDFIITCNRSNWKTFGSCFSDKPSWTSESLPPLNPTDLCSQEPSLSPAYNNNSRLLVLRLGAIIMSSIGLL